MKGGKVVDVTEADTATTEAYLTHWATKGEKHPTLVQEPPFDPTADGEGGEDGGGGGGGDDEDPGDDGE